MLSSRDIDVATAHDVVPLSKLTTDEAVLLLIDLGCRADLRDKPDRAADDIDGLFLEEIDSVDTLLELERVIQPTAMKRTHMKKVLRLLKAIQTKGLSRDKLAHIRQTKHDASTSVSQSNVLKKKKKKNITEEQVLQFKKSLAHTDPMVRMNTMKTLNELLESHESNKLVMTNAGMVQSLVCLLREGDLEMRQLAIDTIRRITDLSVKEQIEESEETLDAIISLLEDPNNFIKAKAVETINFLCRNEDNLLMSMESIRPLVSLLRDPDMQVRYLALAALENISGDDVHAEFAGSIGAIEPLLPFLKDADPIVRKNASRSLMYMGMCEENAIRMIKARAIEPFIELLKDPNIEVRHNAVESLSHLASDAKCAIFLAAAGAIFPLVSLLGDADSHMRTNATSALGHISNVETTRTLVVAANGIPPLVALLGDEDLHMRHEATIALGHIAKEETAGTLIVAANGIPPLVALLGDKDSFMRYHATNALRLIIKNDPDSIDLFVAEGGIRSILTSLLSDPIMVHFSTQRQVTETLWNITRSNKKNVLEAAMLAIEPLLTLLRVGDNHVRQNVAGIIGEIATFPENQMRLVVSGAILPLVLSLTDVDAAVRANAVTALGRIMNNNDANISLVTCVRGMERLVALLEDKDAEVLRRTTETLWNITRSSKKRRILEEVAVAIMPLVSLLRDEDTEVRRSAVGALAKMSIIPANQSRLVTAGAVLPLLVLLKDIDAAVRENAVITLGNIANNNNTDANKTLLTSVMAGESLESLLQDADSEVRKQAKITIDAIEKARTTCNQTEDVRLLEG